MHRILAFVLGLLVAVSFLHAQHVSGSEEEHNLLGLDLEPVTLSFTESYRSKYVFSNGAKLHDDGVLQSDLFVSTKSGFWLDFWSSLPANFSDIGEDYATELYISVGWTGEIDDYKLSFGVGYEDLHSNLSFDGTDFVIFSAEISRDFELSDDFTLSPFARIEVNFTLDGEVAGDALPRVGTRFNWEINDTVSLAGKVMLVYDPGILGGDVAWVSNLEGSFNWKFGDNVTAEFPYVRWVTPLNSVHDGREGEVIFGAGVTFRF